MKVDRRYEAICDVASRDETRPHIVHMKLDRSAARLIATNGWAIAAVPVEVSDTDSSGAVSVRAFRAAAEDRPGKAVEIAATDGALETPEGCRLPRPAPKFPNFNQVMPDFKRGDGGTVSFAVNASLLHDVQKAIGAGHDGVILTIRINGEKKYEPILVEPNMGKNDALGAVMPMHVDRGPSK